MAYVINDDCISCGACEDRIAALEARINEIAEGINGIINAIAALESRIADVEAKLVSVEAASPRFLVRLPSMRASLLSALLQDMRYTVEL